MPDYEYTDKYEPIDWDRLYRVFGKKKVERACKEGVLKIMRMNVFLKTHVPKTLRENYNVKMDRKNLCWIISNKN